MRLEVEDETLLLSNDTVTIINMDLGVIKKFERSPEGYVVIPANLLSPGTVISVKDPGKVRDYVITEKDEEGVIVEALRNVHAIVATGHIISVLASEAPLKGGVMEMAYLRSITCL